MYIGDWCISKREEKNEEIIIITPKISIILIEFLITLEFLGKNGNFLDILRNTYQDFFEIN